MLVFLFFVFTSVFSYNILVYAPLYAVSHNKFMGKLADTLTDAGNNVTILAPVGEENIRKHIGVESTKNIWIVEQDEIMKNKLNKTEDPTVMNGLWLVENSPEDYETCYQGFADMVRETCANLLRNQQFISKLKGSKFDVAILEPISFCGFGLFDFVGIKKIIIASSVTQYEGFVRNSGEPVDTSYVPGLGSHVTDYMNFDQRVKNHLSTDSMARNLERIFEYENILLKEKFGPDFISWKDLLPTASLYFTNSNPYVDYPRPIIQKSVAIGGISVNMEQMKSQKLTEEWDNILNMRKKTVLISFGSMIHSAKMPIEWRNNILENIKRFPDVTFIWKYESDDLKWTDSVDNIHFSKWVPQTALLVDSRLSAFLTHGGLGSTNELAYCGKPAIMVPIFGDQMRNANMLARLNGSIAINKFDLSNFEVVNNALKSILYDESYSKNAQKLAELLNDTPFDPKELVIKNTEFLAKYGPFPSMSPRIQHLNFIERHMLDVEVYLFITRNILSLGISSIILISFLCFLRK